MDDNDLEKQMRDLAAEMSSVIPRHIAASYLLDGHLDKWLEYRKNNPRWVPDLSDLNKVIQDTHQLRFP
ncbi:MAG TPA: hypothetical protein ENK21_07315 [Trueperaceae bacterium]|nr:hypothetical protein [Trueperaceae bacterium]